MFLSGAEAPGGNSRGLVVFLAKYQIKWYALPIK
jgi:hypothetical protein